MKIVLTKEQVIAVLEAEPLELLRSGYWFSNTNFTGVLVKRQECQRCAVGAVINRVVAAGRPGNDVCEAAQYAIDKERAGFDFVGSTITTEPGMDRRRAMCAKQARKYPLSALSALFEALSGFGAYSPGTIRRELVQFVTAHFPPTLVVDVDGIPADPELPTAEESGAVS